MPFPVSPNPGDSYTDAYGTVWIYAGSVNGWYRQTVIPSNETSYTAGLITTDKIIDNTIINADVASNAAIAGTKISPNFGSQNVTTTGTSTAASFIPTSSTAPTNGLYLSAANSVALSTNGNGRLFISSAGLVGIGTSSPTTALTVGGVTPALSLTYNFPLNNTVGALISSVRFGDGDPGREATATISAHVDSIWSAGSGPTALRFNTAPVGSVTALPRLTIDSSGRVGIGTATPQHLLDCTSIGRFTGNTNSAASGAGIEIGYDAGNTIGFIQSYNRGSSTYLSTAVDGSDVRFRISGTERSRIDSSGTFRVKGAGTAGVNDAVQLNGSAPANSLLLDASGRLLVGTSSARSNFYNSPSTNRLQVEGVNYEDSGASFTCNSTSASNVPVVSLNKNNNNTVGTNTRVDPGNLLGVVSFGGNDGAQFVEAATIIAAVDGAPGADDMPGRLVFSTTSDGQASPTPRLTITSTGQVRLAGAGITFNGDTATANELDDYEEGTFTPTVIGSSTAGTATYTNQTGIYTKIGRQVNWLIYVNWTGGTGSGNLQISGLPFTSANISSVNSWSVSFGIVDNIAVAANTQLNGYVSNNSSVVVLTNQVVGGGAYSVQAYDAAGHLLISGSYAAT